MGLGVLCIDEDNTESWGGREREREREKSTFAACECVCYEKGSFFCNFIYFSTVRYITVQVRGDPPLALLLYV